MVRSRLRGLLVVYGVLNVLALASTYGYTLNAPLKHVHMVAGIAMMLFDPLGAWWLSRQLTPTASTRGWLGASLLGLVLGVVDFAALLHILFLAQLVTGVSFGVLVVRASRRLDADA